MRITATAARGHITIMKIGIISDTHENVRNIIRAVLLFKRNKVERVIHCGDIIAPITVQHFEGMNISFVKGNNDGDVEKLHEKIKLINGTFHEEKMEEDIDGKKFFVIHGHDKEALDDAINSGKYDYVLTGHTHITRDEIIGNTRVLNPGAHYWNCENTIMILDTKNDEVSLIDIWQEDAEEI